MGIGRDFELMVQINNEQHELYNATHADEHGNMPTNTKQRVLKCCKRLRKLYKKLYKVFKSYPDDM